MKIQKYENHHLAMNIPLLKSQICEVDQKKDAGCSKNFETCGLHSHLKNLLFPR